MPRDPREALGATTAWAQRLVRGIRNYPGQYAQDTAALWEHSAPAREAIDYELSDPKWNTPMTPTGEIGPLLGTILYPGEKLSNWWHATGRPLERFSNLSPKSKSLQNVYTYLASTPEYAQKAAQSGSRFLYRVKLTQPISVYDVQDPMRAHLFRPWRKYREGWEFTPTRAARDQYTWERVEQASQRLRELGHQGAFVKDEAEQTLAILPEVAGDVLAIAGRDRPSVLPGVGDYGPGFNEKRYKFKKAMNDLLRNDPEINSLTGAEKKDIWTSMQHQIKAIYHPNVIYDPRMKLSSQEIYQKTRDYALERYKLPRDPVTGWLLPRYDLNILQQKPLPPPKPSIAPKTMDELGAFKIWWDEHDPMGEWKLSTALKKWNEWKK